MLAPFAASLTKIQQTDGCREIRITHAVREVKGQILLSMSRTRRSWINALLLWGFGGFFADVSSEPDADLGPTWEVKCARVFVCLWVHSPAVSFRTEHIKDTTEAWAVDCSLKAERGTKCEMEAEAGRRGVWGGRKGEPELRSWETKQVTERKKKRKKAKKNKKTAWNRATTWLSTCRATLLLPLTTSSRTFLLLPVFFCSPPRSLSVSLGPGLTLLPRIITAALARSPLMLLLIHTSSRLVTPAVLLSRSDLAFCLTPGRSSVHSPSGDGRRRGRRWRAEDRRREHMVS